MPFGRSFQSSYSSLGEQTFTTKNIIGALLGLIISICLIACGALLVNDESIIKEIDPEKISTLNTTFGTACIVLGCLMVLYGAFRFFTKSN